MSIFIKERACPKKGAICVPALRKCGNQAQ